MRKAFLLVGNENFGKSRTWIELTGAGNSRYVNIENKEFLLKRKLNDDIGKDLLEYVEDVIKDDQREYLLMSFCPNFKEPHTFSVEILQTLKKEFKIYFFVLMKEYGGDKVITSEEIKELEKYGDVFPYAASENAVDRAEELVKYIKKNM